MATAANQIVAYKDAVEQVLKISKAARDSDSELWLIVMCRHRNLIKTLGHDGFFKLQRVLKDKKNPTIETLGRIRRQFQSEGKYLSDNRKLKRKQQSEVKKALGYHNTEGEA